MKRVGRYEVVGGRAFMGHKHGDVFIAELDENAEARSVNRGSLRLLERLEMDLPVGKYRLPVGWREETDG